MKKLRVAVVFGGKSGEHEVSIVSARSIISALDRRMFRAVPVGVTRDGRWMHGADALRMLVGKSPRGRGFARPTLPDGIDAAFPIIHGTFGEDGTLQGFFEMAGVPYVGCSVLGSAVGMDKDVSKRLLEHAGIPVAPAIVMRSGDKVPPRVKFPVFVKPCRMGSSVGVSKAKNSLGLAAAIKEAFRYDDKILLEQAVPNAREIECAVTGNGPYSVSTFGEIVPSGEFYDFRAKYVDGASQSIIPANIPLRKLRELKIAAENACRALCVEGLARVDFLMDRKNGRWVLNEINTLPGFTSISMFPKLWAKTGLSYPRLLTKIIGLALERGRAKNRLTTTFNSDSDWYKKT